MNNKVFVGGIAWTTSDDGLKQHFSQVGNVVEAKIIIDRMKNRSKGFGFVTFETEAEAEKAINELNNSELDGRQLRVSLARPQEQRQ